MVRDTHIVRSEPCQGRLAYSQVSLQSVKKDVMTDGVKSGREIEEEKDIDDLVIPTGHNCTLDKDQCSLAAVV